MITPFDKTKFLSYLELESDLFVGHVPELLVVGVEVVVEVVISVLIL